METEALVRGDPHNSPSEPRPVWRTGRAPGFAQIPIRISIRVSDETEI